jgi:hypothetical protein
VSRCTPPGRCLPIPGSRWPPGAVTADRAYAHSKLGRQDKALTLLLTAERMSPDWIRHQTQVRSITRDLLAAEKARSTPLRDLAQRIGVRRG